MYINPNTAKMTVNGVNLLFNFDNGVVSGIDENGLKFFESILSDKFEQNCLTKKELEFFLFLKDNTFISEKKFIKSDKVVSAYLHLTNKCNLHCEGSKAIRKELENYTTINPLNASLEYKEIKKISIENVNYKIQGKNILRNINLNLQQGKKYALVGSSGSGKTSILNIIGLLNDEFEGTLEVNDDKRIESRGRYLSQIGYVFQENYLFKGNLRDNLTLYKNYSEEEVKEAIKFAELDSKFTIESYISEEGNNLSGGEKQRIALARAYLSRPSLLLLDEFTSSLDVITTEKINRKITLLKNNIIVLITHKLDGQFLEQFDEIICMENGEIVEKDTFKQLILNKKNFWNLFIKNSSGDENERDIAF